MVRCADSRSRVEDGRVHTIQAGPAVEGVPNTVDAAPFVEKPNADTADRCVAEGGYAWNAGMFVTSAEVLLGHLAELIPDLYEGLTPITHAIAEPWPPGATWQAATPWTRRHQGGHANPRPVSAVGRALDPPNRQVFRQRARPATGSRDACEPIGHRRPPHLQHGNGIGADAPNALHQGSGHFI